MGNGLNLDMDAITSICRRHHVRRLALFGSAATEAFDPEASDVDFLVEFTEDAEGLFDAYFGLKDDLERLVGRPVDLVMSKSLQNPFFASSVEQTRRELYAA